MILCPGNEGHFQRLSVHSIGVVGNQLREPVMSDAKKVMPDFLFGRRRDLEVQPGAELMLAGFLVTKFGRGHILGESERQRINTVINRLVTELLAGRVTEDATMGIWEADVRPANGVDLPIPYEVVETWMADKMVLGICIDPAGKGSLTTVSHDASMRPEFPRRLIMPL